MTAVANDIEIRLPGVDERPDPDIARDAIKRIKTAACMGHDPGDRQERLGYTLKVKSNGTISGNGRNTHFNEFGVQGIVNSIIVKPRGALMEIRRKIEDALRRAAEIDASRVTVETSESEVILRGSVRSWVEREDAERAAWWAPGI